MYITETENNNLRTRADEINVGDIVTGHISASNDVDCFKVLFPVSAIVNFELDIPNGTDYRIRVYKNDNSDTNVETEDIRLGSYGEMRTCSCRVTPNDTYYVCISANTSKLYSASYNYTLRVFYPLEYSARCGIVLQLRRLFAKTQSRHLSVHSLAKSD